VDDVPNHPDEKLVVGGSPLGKRIVASLSFFLDLLVVVELGDIGIVVSRRSIVILDTTNLQSLLPINTLNHAVYCLVFSNFWCVS
jgi:hypothetical protein